MFIATMLFMTLMVSVSQARPLAPEDQGFITEKYHHKVRVFPDGRRETIFSITYRVLSEKGVEALSLYRIVFDLNREQIRELTVQVENNGKKFVLDPKNIEEKSLFAGLSGFDETRSKIIPLPNLVVGTRVHVDYVHDLLKAEYEGLVMGRFVFPFSNSVEDFYFEVTMPKSLQHAIHDPSGLLNESTTVSEKGEDRRLVVIKQPFPGVGSIMERDAFLPKNDLAWIEYTNARDFLSAGNVARQGYAVVLSEDLPESAEKLFASKPPGRVVTEADGARRLEMAFEIIVKNFRYFADWRSVDGGFVPRPLKVIAETGYGDCKDFAVLMVKAARHLGLEADVALVFRGFDDYQSLNLPNLSVFNHAIVRVKKPQNKGFWWIDATNATPHVGLVPPDIGGRKALVLSEEPELVELPQDTPHMTRQNVKLILDLKDAPALGLEAQLSMNGHLGWSVQDDLRGESGLAAKEYLVNFLGLSNFSVTDYRLEKFSKKNVYPFDTEIWAQISDTAGIKRSGDLKIIPVWTFGSAHYRVMDTKPEDRTSDLNLGILERVDVLQQIKPDSYGEVLGAPPSCEIKSPWLDYTRKVDRENGFSIFDQYTVKKSRIAVHEMRQEGFLKLQSDLKKCLEGVSVVVR